MNILEHHIKEVHSLKDVTSEYNSHTNDIASEPLLEVDLTCNCYGVQKRCTMKFWESEWKSSVERGFFYA